MRGHSPVILVSGASQLFYARLIKAVVRDEEGQKSDTLTVELDDRGNAVPVPKKGTRLEVSLGYRETGVFRRGSFEVHATELKGSAEGEIVVVQAKGTGVSETGKLKEIGSESFAEGATLAAIARTIAGRAGLSLRIDGAMAAIAYAAGAYRHAQSGLDFLSRLAAGAGGLVRVQGTVMSITARGSNANAAGQAIAPAMVRKGDCREWSCSPGDRPQYGKVLAPWVDQVTGKQRFEERPTGQQGPFFKLREPAKTQAEARKAAEAKAGELSRRTGNCTFTMAGRTDGEAGAELIALGFRPEISGSWRIKAREDVFEPGPSGGWTTKFECSAPEGGKKAK